MKKEIAKQKYQNGEIQIRYDDKSKKYLFEDLVGRSFITWDGEPRFYFKNRISTDKFLNAKVINLSEITESEEINTPSHYTNDKGTLYKIAQEREWNAYVFDVVKRLDRAEKKGEFLSDIDKAIHVLQLYKQEQGYRFQNQVEPLNK